MLPSSERRWRGRAPTTLRGAAAGAYRRCSPWAASAMTTRNSGTPWATTPSTGHLPAKGGSRLT
eukprot:5430439-Pyramimonas_sp.AAC.1